MDKFVGGFKVRNISAIMLLYSSFLSVLIGGSPLLHNLDLFVISVKCKLEDLISVKA